MGDDEVLDLGGKIARMVEDAGVGAAALVAAFGDDAAAAEVAEDVVAVAGDPDGGGAGEFAFQAERLVDHDFAGEGDEHEVGAEVDDLDRIRGGGVRHAAA